MSFPQQVGRLFNASIAGSGVTITRYPANAAGTALKASGNTTGAYKYAAASANVKQILAAATITSGPFRIVGFVLDTASAVSIFVIKVGSGTGAGTALNRQVEIGWNLKSDVGSFSPVILPAGCIPTIPNDGVNDAILADAASSNVAADDTINCAVFVAQNIGV
jgi:hypothetical protein